MTDILETGLEFFPEHLSKTNLDIHDEFGGLLICGETMEHLLELCDNKTGVAKIIKLKIKKPEPPIKKPPVKKDYSYLPKYSHDYVDR